MSSFTKINSYVGKDQEIIGLNTGYPNLNKATLGFQKGDLMILAARPAVGKSSYAINLALQVAKNNNAHVAFFSLEMSIEQLLMRIYAYQAGVDLSKQIEQIAPAVYSPIPARDKTSSYSDGKIPPYLSIICMAAFCRFLARL